MSATGLAGLDWDVTIRGIAVVATGTAVLMGSVWLLLATNTGARLGTLLSLPVVNVIAILVEEIRRRDWSFVIAALLVLALLGFNVVRRLFE